MKNLEKEAVGFFKGIGRMHGLDDLSSMIFAILITEPEEITMQDLAKKTGYSLASISNKVKMLVDFGVITRNAKPGSKKAYLYMEKDFLKLFKTRFLQAQARVNMTGAEVERILKKYGSKYNSEREKKQIDNLLMLKDYIKKVQPIINELTKKIEAIS